MLTYKVMVIAALILSLAASLIWNWNQHLDKLEMRDALEASQSRVEELRADIRRQAEALAERETEINSLTAAKNRLNRQLREAAANDAETKLWVDAIVPASVDRLLRGEDGSAVHPADAAGAVPDAGMERQDQR